MKSGTKLTLGFMSGFVATVVSMAVVWQYLGEPNSVIGGTITWVPVTGIVGIILTFGLNLAYAHEVEVGT